MNHLIPPFDAYRVFVEPWTINLSQTLLMTSIALIVALSAALIGNYLVLRRMSMLGDAISHSALPGIVIAFLELVKHSVYIICVDDTRHEDAHLCTLVLCPFVPRLVFIRFVAIRLVPSQ